MADNVTANPGAGGPIFATDEIAGIHYPITKIGFGAADSITLVSAAAGFPVAQQGNWSVILAAGDNNIGNVDVLTMPATAAEGAALPAVLTVVGADDGAAVRPLQTNAGGDLKVTLDGESVTVNAGAGTFAVDQVSAAKLDYDTGAGVYSQLVVGIALPGSGGPVAGGTSANPLRVDPTGATIQPVAGTITANQGGLWDIRNITGTVTLPTGAATLAEQQTQTASLQLLDDAVATVNGAVPAKGILVCGRDATGSRPLSTNDLGELQVNIGTMPDVVLGDGTANVGNVCVAGRTSGGLMTHRAISAAGVNATSVKAAAGQLYWAYITNTNASPRWLKLYDKAGVPVVGTDVPKLTLLIPGNTNGGGFHLQTPVGIAFTQGIAFALTTGVADNDATGVGANEIVVNLGYV